VPRRGREDKALIAEGLDGAKDSIAAYMVLLLELSHGRLRTVAPLAFGDPGRSMAASCRWAVRVLH